MSNLIIIREIEIDSIDLVLYRQLNSSILFFNSPTPVDIIAPDAPTNLIAIVTEDDEIQLNWDNNSEEDLDHYNIYRDSVKIDESLTNEYLDNSVSLNTEYDYYITAVDTSDNESTASNTETIISISPGWYTPVDSGGFNLTDAPVTMRVGFAVWDSSNDVFYIVGAYNGSSYLNNIYKYDPNTGIWSEEYDGSSGNASHFGAGNGSYTAWLINGIIYFGFGTSTTTTIYAYRLSDSTYLGAVYILPSGNFGGSIKSIDITGNRIIVSGNTSRQNRTALIDGFDGTIELTELADFPDGHSAYSASSCYVDGYFYFKSGSSSTSSSILTNKFYRYDPVGDSWLEITVAPTSGGGGILWHYNGNIYWFRQTTSIGSFIHVYNINDNSWSTLETNDAPTETNNSIHAIRKTNQLWCFGGLDGVTSDKINVRVV